MMPRHIHPLSLAILLAVTVATVSAIEIDGDMGDWTNGVAFEIPTDALAQIQTPFAAVENLWIAHDDTFLYFRVRFERPRPFTDESQSEFVEGYWTNRRYIVLDVNGDGRPDYWTTQVAVGDGGLNHTYVVDLSGERPQTYLWHEGHRAWDPDTGPMGHYSPDGREIEIRVPREPLNIQGSTIGVQVKMSLRDAIEGPNVWTNDVYPSPDTFFLYDIASASAVRAAETAGPPSLEMTRTDVAPEIDGALDDAAWEGAPILDGFLLNRGNAPAEAQTTAQITWDDRALYLAVRADEPHMDLLTTEAVEAEAKRVWRDDLIELFVDFHNDERTFTHLGITAIGATVGEFTVVRGAARTAIDIEPDIDVAWSHGEDHWVVEAAIGWSTFGVRPRAGEVWGLNVNRGRPHAGEYSSWAGVQGSFLQPTAFGEMVFPHEEGLRVVSRGMAARAGNADQTNTFVAEMAGAPLSASVSVRRADDETFADSVGAAADETLRLPYVVTGERGETVAFIVSSEGVTLYEASIPVVQTDFPKVWVTEEPVFEELLGDAGPGMAAEGVLYWSHDIAGYQIAPVVLKHAQPWTLRGAYEQAAEHNLHYLDSGTLLGRDPFETRRFAEELGVKIIAMGSQRAGTEDTPRGDNNYAYVIDYENQEVYLQRLGDYVREWRDRVWGTSTADEFQDHQITLGLKLHYDGEEPYPFMEQVDREVREEFGYGQFGIPESLDDRDPFRWIAYRRWYNDRFMDFQRRIYEMVKEIDEDLVVVGPDPISQIQPFDYSGYARWCDVVTHQTYPRGSREQDVAWITKTVRDLSGVPTMPCTHVENYANSFRPDEVVELMSQVYRGGGEGFHLYLPDTSGRRTPHNMELDRFGSWPRHEAIMGVLETSRTMDRPVYPDSDAAILFSNDAYMAEFLGGRQGADPYRWMFQLIGPYAGGWFTVVSDNQIGRDEIDLSQYSAIYLPEAEYQRREVAEALIAWVEEGGTLIVTDPEAFTWHLDGSEMRDLRDRLFPATGEATDAETVTVAEGSPLAVEGQFPVFGVAVALQPAAGDRPLLTYPDGSVAAAARSVGEGEVWYFGFESMIQQALGSPWVDWWRAVHESLGEETDLPIWRFTLPPVESAVIEPPVGRCLTGNYHVWDTNEAIPMANLQVDGRYSYSVPPDWGRDEGGERDVPFAEGDLTDRRSALTHNDEDYDAHLRKFAVGWQTTEPIAIEFDLAEAFPLDRVWLLTGQSHPAMTVTGLVDGAWVSLGSVEGFPVDHSRDFPERIIPIAPDAPAVRRLRLEIAAREEGQRLIIPEVEIWARE
ncbi:MAG: sugar-binding protein [Armatimonadota bacterium]